VIVSVHCRDISLSVSRIEQTEIAYGLVVTVFVKLPHTFCYGMFNITVLPPFMWYTVLSMASKLTHLFLPPTNVNIS